jgi:hypothetical protein
VRIFVVTSLVVLALGSLLAVAGDPPRSNTKPANPSSGTVRGNEQGGRPDRVEKLDEAREAAVLEFVRENHPELAELLEQLKAMKPEQYARAIAELSQVNKTLANLKRNDDGRYPLALEAWKARSRAELLTAQLAGTPGPELERQLRAAVENLVAVEIRQQRLERELVEVRLQRLNETIKRLESRRDAVVESRYQSLLKKGQRARRLEAGQGAPSRSAGTKGED